VAAADRTGRVVQYINPPGMIKSPAFSQAVVITAPSRTVYIGAQTAVDGNGNVVGKGDVVAQTEQILENIDLCLEAAGARREHVVNWNIYVVAGQPVEAAAGVGMRWLAGRAEPPLNTVTFVSEFPNSEWLVMIDAMAVVP
jgi:enamine deaminase RidA (YjgF/YER057c/UK114 family)